jgi:hypothetical protein
MGSSSSNARDAAAPPPSPPPSPPAAPAPLHVMDAEEDDENVKQLNECAALYLSLQARPFTPHVLSPFLICSAARKSHICSITSPDSTVPLSCRTASSSPTATGKPAKHVSIATEFHFLFLHCRCQICCSIFNW